MTELEIRVTAELREIRAALAQLTGQIDAVNQRAARGATGGRALASSLQQAAKRGREAATAADQVRGNIAGAVSELKLLVGGLGATMVQANESDSAPVGSGESRVDRDGDSGRLPSGGLENADFDDDHHGIGDDDFDDDHGDFDDDHEDRDDD